MEQFKESDKVILIKNRDEYAAHGIYKGMVGTLNDSRKINGELYVYFYVYVDESLRRTRIKEEDLILWSQEKEREYDCPGNLPREMQITPFIMENYVIKFKEYDTVILTKDRDEYTKYGIYKGMVGTILDPYKIHGEWEVYFYVNADESMRFTCIKEEDLVMWSKEIEDEYDCPGNLPSDKHNTPYLSSF